MIFKEEHILDKTKIKIISDDNQFTYKLFIKLRL